MTSKLGLANPTLEINDQVVPYKPNSLTFKGGSGDITVRPQSAGGASVENVITQDIETRKSMIKFTLLAETGNMDLIDDFSQLSIGAAGVVIRLSAPSFTRTFRGMRLIADPERSIGAEGEAELEFHGDPTG